MNILITNIGRRNYLVEFIKSIEYFDGNVYVSDCDKTASGLYGVCDEHFILSKPVDNEEKYVDELIELCVEKNINIVIPIIDPEIYILSKYRKKFEEYNIMVLVSSKKVLDICYNKIETNKFLNESSLSTVKTYENLESFNLDYKKKITEFPVFVKPIYGSGSENSYKVDNYQKLKTIYNNDLIIQEYIDGEEYGIDIFNDNKNNPVSIVIKKKLGMRSGETDKAITVSDNLILKEMKKLAIKLGHFGPLDCDVIKNENNVYIIDLNPRFGGGYPATHMAGVNFLELVIKLFNQDVIKPNFNNYEVDQLTMKDIGIKTVKI